VARCPRDAPQVKAEILSLLISSSSLTLDATTASCPKNLTDIYCNKDLPNWNQVKKHGSSNDQLVSDWVTTEEGETAYFRFYMADPCTGFHIRLNYQYGTIETYVSTLSSLPGSYATNILLPYISNNTWSSPAIYPGHNHITICPTLASYKPGTYVIAAVCRKPEAKFRVEIYTGKAITQRPGGGPITTVDGTKKPVYCKNSTSIVCLNDTMPYLFNGLPGTFPLMKIPVSGKKGDCTPPITSSSLFSSLFLFFFSSSLLLLSSHSLLMKPNNKQLVYLENLIPGTYSFVLVSFVKAISYNEAAVSACFESHPLRTTNAN